ncbi:MAG: trypsin-like peptidase domain-containing protein [Kofleriaceae bacterium]
MGQQLWRVMAGLFPVPLDAIAFAERFEVDRLDLPPNLSPRQLWHVLLEQTAIKGTTRDLVASALEQNPRSPHAGFLRALIDHRTCPVSPEPVSGFDPGVTEPEALLFTEDLTMAVGEVPNLVATLVRLHALTPAVCLLRVRNAYGSFFGTGCKIGPDWVLTAEHVVSPGNERAVEVHVDFGFDVDASGASRDVVHLVGDPASIVGARDHDWAVLRVPGMDPAWPALELASAPAPKEGDLAYIVQHPEGHRMRLGFVRNRVTAVTDDYVQYLTDTQPGSSGAPVFDGAGRLIALHHRGGTPTQYLGKAPLTKNQGVRISQIYAGLVANGILRRDA